ncbi:sulfotransferase 1C2-like [Limulus polyphemus]|uniref:Sulfotransferase 1C2-like n=1 Tax=Limulus polyphemus TaxID=6850 RepID=A0ABM1T7V1_LIMPO|nr:sulfotransferase 1C2-like [Limulus polyphemus]
MATSGEKKEKSSNNYIHGIYFPSIFKKENIENVISMKPRDDDIFVVTYPKCGTTWMTYIIWEILNKGAPLPPANSLLFQLAPFLDLSGTEVAETMESPRLFRTHLPYRLVPKNPSTKYVYVTRNPFDCCVSFYYHMKGMKHISGVSGSFEDFFEDFILGKVGYGDYFDHLKEGYHHRNDPNILFVTYEGMKQDPKGHILKVAKFIGEEHLKSLQENEEILEMILKNSQVFTDKADPSNQIKVDFFRKGIIGDWKNHFSPEQKERLEQRMKEKLDGTEIPSLWEGIL